MKQMRLSIPSCNHGLTLVELMVAMVLALLLSGVAIQVYMTNKTTYTNTEALSRIQENGRFAIEFLTKEIRMAGLVGCHVSSVANSVDDTSGDWKYDFNNSVLGYEGGASTFPTEIASDVVGGSDAIIISRGDETDFYIKDHNALSAVFHTTGSNNFKQGEILMVVDCLKMQAGIFQRADSNISDTSAQIDHNTGVGVIDPGNCTKKLWGNFDCSDTSTASSVDYTDDAKLLRMKNTIFYIANGRNNKKGQAIPSLYHEFVTQSGGAVTTFAEELVEGIEDFQILYGVDTDATEDGVANRYVTADNVASVASWDKVASVRMFLLARSIEQVGGDAKPYTFMGITTTPSDTYIRRQFSATIQVRNHGLGL